MPFLVVFSQGNNFPWRGARRVIATMTFASVRGVLWPISDVDIAGAPRRTLQSFSRRECGTLSLGSRAKTRISE